MRIRRRGYPAESRTFETKAAAERYARGIESEMDNGTFVSRAEAESTTLAELLERYLAEVTAAKKGAEPESYRIRALLRHDLAARIVATITTSPRESSPRSAAPTSPPTATSASPRSRPGASSVSS